MQTLSVKLSLNFLFALGHFSPTLKAINDRFKRRRKQAEKKLKLTFIITICAFGTNNACLPNFKS